MSDDFVFVSRIVVLDADGFIAEYEDSPTVGFIQSDSFENIIHACVGIWEAGDQAARLGTLEGFHYAMNPVRVSRSSAQEFAAKVGTAEGDNILVGSIV